MSPMLRRAQRGGEGLGLVWLSRTYGCHRQFRTQSVSSSKQSCKLSSRSHAPRLYAVTQSRRHRGRTSMKKLIMSAAIIMSALSTFTAFAAPPARVTPATPCAHCAHKVAETAFAQRGQHALGVQPCNHGAVATNVRWGNAPKPCPHCNHMG